MVCRSTNPIRRIAMTSLRNRGEVCMQSDTPAALSMANQATVGLLCVVGGGTSGRWCAVSGETRWPR